MNSNKFLLVILILSFFISSQVAGEKAKYLHFPLNDSLKTAQGNNTLSGEGAFVKIWSGRRFVFAVQR